MTPRPLPAWALAAALACTAAGAQMPATAVPAAAATAPTQRLRGTVESLDATRLTVKTRTGETVVLRLADAFGVNEVLPVALSQIQPGAYVGAAAMPAADGSLQALEVLVFPEAARGSGEGHYPWDLQPGSTMTNATVAELAEAPAGRTLKLKYKNGEKTVTVPAGVPVVTFKPADRALLVPGAPVVVMAQSLDGQWTAQRALAGRNGFVPPM